MGHSFLYARQNMAYYGIPLFVRPSMPHTITSLTDRSRRDIHCIDKKGEQVRGVILISLENASFYMVYTIN